jgi:glutamate formiminotransferase/formiminotetrahydrofolate cyclodeaminase
MKLVECVPNFSEGQNKDTIEEIATAISSVSGVDLLDVDPGTDTNRTVYTFIGEPEAVLKGAFMGIAKAHQLIDMRKHQGTHARMGACDVCPFVPLQGVEMEECVELAKRLAKQVAEELEIPVYLYEEAASRPERRNLATVRKGEYEELAKKLQDPEWQPDYGPARFNEKFGALITGAREFLIAYNFNLNTKDTAIAREIAFAIRERGHKKTPGKFKYVKAVGWYLEDFQIAQVSMNLTNYKKTPLAEVFDEVCRLAEEKGVKCTGSELVGLIPKDCLIAAGQHYQKPEEQLSEDDTISLAVEKLGLSQLYPFEIDKKIIENRIKKPGRLASLSVKDFVDETASKSPAPGGGSIAALCGSLAAGLASMVAGLTIGKKGYQDVADKMQSLLAKAQKSKDILLKAVDDDTAAFNAIMAAFRLPKTTDEEKEARKQAIQDATRQAICVPLEVLRECQAVVALAETAVKLGNKNSLSDAGVAGLCSQAAASGAYYNVLINLGGLKDSDFVSQVKKEADQLIDEIRNKAGQIAKQVEKLLS